MLGEVVELPLAEAKEVEHLRVDLRRAGEHVLGAEDEQLLAGEVLEPALQLLGVEAAGEVGAVAVLVVGPCRSGGPPLAISASSTPARRSGSAASASSKPSFSRPVRDIIW